MPVDSSTGKMNRPKFVLKELSASSVLTVNLSEVTVIYFIQYGKFKRWLICNFFRTALLWSITQRTTVSNDPEECSSHPLRSGRQISLFLSFRRVVNVIYSFLGNSPASEI